MRHQKAQGNPMPAKMKVSCNRTLHRQHLIVHSLLAQSLGSCVLFLTLPMIWVKLVISWVQQIRNVGCGQLDATQTLQGNVCHFRATDPKPPLSTNNQSFELDFQPQVLHTSSGLSRNGCSVVQAEPTSLLRVRHTLTACAHHSGFVWDEEYAEEIFKGCLSALSYLSFLTPSCSKGPFKEWDFSSVMLRQFNSFGEKN